MNHVRCSRALIATLSGLLVLDATNAASHREAPLTALDHKADITDVFSFVSYDDPTKVTMILCTDPLLEPSNGPNYFPFDPDIQYAINVDNNFDALEDLSFQFRFNTELRLPGVFTTAVGAGTGIAAPDNSPPPVPPGTPIVPPAITSLDGPGSEGLGLRQTYTVSLVRGRGSSAESTVLGTGIAVPSNAGPRTMPDYPTLFDQGITELDDIRVFAGTVDDPFWIDLGAAFDSLNLRPMAFATGIAGVLAETQDADDATNFAPDDVAGFNVNAIAVEVPVEMLTQDGALHGADDPLATIGVWGTTSRPRVRVIPRDPNRKALASRSFSQVQRMGNPLINELLIGTGDKDRFSRFDPVVDDQFSDYFLDPALARVLNAIYEANVSPGVLPIPEPPRNDLLPLLQYRPPISPPTTPAGPVADILRLNTGIAPTPAANRSRLGFLTLLDGNTANDDPAGFPNGRRVSDDVTDISLRVVLGILAGSPFNGFPHNRVGDGVNTNDVPYSETFPYLGAAHSGKDSRHVDPLEPGCIGTCPSD